MAMDNYDIADKFSLLSKLMDIHGENSFKTKSYAIAAFTIEKLPEPITSIPKDKIFSIKGIGDAIGKKIIEILETGELRLLTEYIEKTPAGLIEMLHIKGLGPKKIATVWKEMEIESVGELLYACQENRLLLFKGFGEKTQNNIRETIEFYIKNKGSYLFAEVESTAMTLDERLRQELPGEQLELSGEFRRQMEIINQLEWVTTASASRLKELFSQKSHTVVSEEPGRITFTGLDNLALRFHCTPPESFGTLVFETSCSERFLASWKAAFAEEHLPAVSSEAEIFSSKKIPFIPAFLREGAFKPKNTEQEAITVLEKKDIKGIIHCHSNWSDGSNTLEEMADACIKDGFEYMVISDHSKSAFYAKGLTEDRIREQHLYIDELNKKFSPFKIFKSIECDILGDGNLDYSDNILSTFDLVIASIHSNLKMTEEKAMVRLLKAIGNPHTTILGHMTGRLLLSRPGYPADHRAVIDACVAAGVVIELNAHPRRLDIDWRWIEYVLEKKGIISIDPDAHTVEGFKDIRYGVLVAQKAGLMRENNLSSFSLAQLENFLLNKKKETGSEWQFQLIRSPDDG